MLVTLRRKYTICAAHQLPYHNGKCHNRHGHTYTIWIELKGAVHDENPLDPESGMLMDFSELDKIINPTILLLDHHDLNDFLHNPTAEELCYFIATNINKPDSALFNLINAIEVWESENSMVRLEV